ncbi:MAG TPA: hypothetical protein VFQ87_03195 [Bradyrhizobium sp.]|jgi:hypothetical protein|nr:hypothetical protein [Bradyrhizobium sp.]
MKTDEKIALFVASGAALVGAAWWWSEENGGADVLDMVTDYLALLSTSEAERMEQLEPETQSKLHDLILALGTIDGVRVHVGQTRRTSAQEKANYEAGKTSANLTHSWHELGRAVDLYPIDPDTGKPDMDGRRVDLFRTMHDRAKLMGWHGIAFNDDGTKKILTNAKKQKIWDGGHLENRGSYVTIAQAWAAEGPATA